MVSSHFVSLLVFLTCLLRLIDAQYTLDPCRCDAECEGERICTFFETISNFGPCGPDKEMCICTFTADANFLQTCDLDFDCLEGDVCEGMPGRDVKSCVSKCGGIERVNCPESPEKPECDPPSPPTITPRPSKTPAPSKTPKPSSIPSLEPTTVGPSAPTPVGQPDEMLDEFPSGTANMELEPVSPEPSLTPEPTRRRRKPPKSKPPEEPDEDTGTGLTRDSCTSPSECKPPRKCYTIDSQASCNPDVGCECTPPTPVLCESDDDCDDGEQCYDNSGDGQEDDEEKMCVSTCYFYKKNDPDKYEAECKSDGMKPSSESEISPPVSPPAFSPGAVTTGTLTPTPTEAICVAAGELEGVEKVFEQDLHAWVLCDAGGSCATPGHMVMWKGEGMMMKSYCNVIGCVKRVMAVNSPRWRAGVIRAKTEGLVYTSFAARFETKAEERVLAAVVRLVV